MKKLSAGVVAGLSLTGAVMSMTVGAQEQQATPTPKVYLAMSPTNVDIGFKQFMDYSPAVHANPGGRKALESYVLDAVRPSADELAAELRQAIQASLGSKATLTDMPNNAAPGANTFGKSLAELPFMQRRNAPVTVAVSVVSLTTDYVGTLENPNPISKASDSIFDFSKIGKSIANISGKKPLTFDGVTRLTYQAQYKVYATATGELLREGKVGPLTVESSQWQGSWTFPPNEPYWETTCDDRGICTNAFSQEKAAKLATDPRPTVLPETIAKIKPLVKEAVTKSFSDWGDLIAAGQELATAKR